MRKSSVLVRGIGYKGMKYPSSKEYKPVKEHTLWSNMLHRCTKKCWVKYPAYVDTTCSENFKSYSYFYEWCNKQIGFNEKDEAGKNWNLDKDLLIKGNKLYSEDTCVFVPARVNKLLTKRHNFRGEWPLGVSWHTKTGKFRSYCSDGNNKQIFLGLFATPQEAFSAYKVFKEVLIKQVANEYKHQLDYRVYDALLNYEVNIND